MLMEDHKFDFFWMNDKLVTAVLCFVSHIYNQAARIRVNNVVGVYYVQVSLLLLQVSAFASYWLENCANFTPTPEENNQ